MTFPVAWLPSDQAAPRYTRAFGTPDTNAADIAALDSVTRSAGGIGQPPDAAHSHPLALPKAMVYSVGQSSVPTSTWTAISFLEETFGLNAMWSNVNPTRMVATWTGFIWLYAQGLIINGAASGGTRAMRIYKNGFGNNCWPGTDTWKTPSVELLAAMNGVISCGGIAPCVAGDYFEVWVFQDSGAGQTASDVLLQGMAIGI